MSGLLTHSAQDVREAAMQAVDIAVRNGARARVSVLHQGNAMIAVRGGEVETAERSGSQNLSITVFHKSRRGSASTAGFDRAAIERVIEEAMLIARCVQPDLDADMPPSDWLAFAGPAPDIFAESPRNPDALLEAAMAIDRAANELVACDTRLRSGECAAVASEGLWTLATSDGFCRSVHRSNDGRWSVMLAQDDGGSTSDYAETQARSGVDLAAPAALAKCATERARRALGARPIKSRRCAVLFDPRAAARLVGELAGALTGTAQQRKLSFLPEPIGRSIAAPHLDLMEDPFEPLGLSSGGFDSEGIAGSRRTVLRQGVAEGLFLSTTSARKLGLKSTGNADGFYNLRLTSSAQGGDWQAMLQKLGTGLVVTGFQGGKTDPTTGNWVQAIKGLWVEDGRVIHAVTDVTLAGTMPAMLAGIQAVGCDVERQGGIRTGSILIDDMQVGGEA